MASLRFLIAKASSNRSQICVQRKAVDAIMKATLAASTASSVPRLAAAKAPPLLGNQGERFPFNSIRLSHPIEKSSSKMNRRTTCNSSGTPLGVPSFLLRLQPKRGNFSVNEPTRHLARSVQSQYS
jgi:hypothetical protein